jgi:Tfp pilus assembly protein PilO
MNSNRIWMIGAALAAIGIVLLGWFLGVQPQIAAGVDSNSKRADVDAQNVVQRQELDTLKKQFASIDALDQELAQLRVSLPPDAAIAALIGELQRNTAGNHVSFKALTVGDAQLYQPTVAVVPAVPPTDGATPTATPTPEAGAAAEVPTPAAAAAPLGTPAFSSPLVDASNFVVIPVSVTVGGSYHDIVAFTKSLQFGDRLVLVNALTLKPGDAGGYEGVMSGFVYVLRDPTQTGLPSPFPTATPTPTHTPTPTATATHTATHTPTPTATH